jgi:hypothetical protein
VLFEIAEGKGPGKVGKALVVLLDVLSNRSIVSCRESFGSNFKRKVNRPRLRSVRAMAEAESVKRAGS